MNKVRSGIVLGLSLMVLSVFATDAIAAFGYCSISGADGVILDLNDNGRPDGVGLGDALYRLEFDPDAPPAPDPNIRISIHDALGSGILWLGRATMSSDMVSILFPDSAALTLGKTCGNPYLNSGSWSQYSAMVNGALMDDTGDNKPDTIMLNGGNPEMPAMVMDIPLMFHSNGGVFWMLPKMLPYGPGPLAPEVDIHHNYFVPVDNANQRIYVQCGDQIMAEVRNMTCGFSAIPTTSFWGYAALVSLMFAAGIWGMRRAGAGNGLSIG